EEIVIPGRAGPGDESDAPVGAEGRDAAVAALLNAAASPPFMTAHRVVVARDVGALTAGDVDGIVRYLEDPLDTTILVFVAGGGPIPAALSKQLKAVKAQERAPESEKTDKVLIGSAHDAGLLLSPDAATLISSHLGEDAGRVAALVEVLAAAYAPDVLLGVDDVTPYLGEAGAVPSYLLTNAIEEGDRASRRGTLHSLRTAASAQQPRPMPPLQVMSLLNGYYRRILRLDDPS